MIVTRRGFFGAAASATAASAVPSQSIAPPAPVVQEYELERFFVAGFRFHHGPDLLMELEAGGRLALVREPHNPYDARAVALFHQGRRIGYVPRVVNAPIARLLDQRAPLACRMVYVDREAEPWKAVDAVVTIKGARSMV